MDAATWAGVFETAPAPETAPAALIGLLSSSSRRRGSPTPSTTLGPATPDRAEQLVREPIRRPAAAQLRGAVRRYVGDGPRSVPTCTHAVRRRARRRTRGGPGV